MESKGMKYEFLARPCYCSSQEEMGRWIFALLPKDMSKEIRSNFGGLEEGWGRMKITAKVNSTEWKTSIWFDTKKDTYMLPLKAEIRKKEKIVLDENVKIVIFVKFY